MLKPTLGGILVNRVIEDVSAGGIVLTGQEKSKSYVGIVCAVADDVTEIQIGDVVYFTSLEGYEMRADGDQYIVVRQDDVVAVMQGS